MNAKSIEILNGIIAIVLLLIYSFTLGHMILKVMNWDMADGNLIFNNNIIWVANVVGGLVAGVIIANLALSKPGETPVTQVREISRQYGQKLLKTVIWSYITVWLLIGTAAFLVGVILFPEINNTLNEIGKYWLGILLGSAYAWFGIKLNQTASNPANSITSDGL
jgi:hypothetical protein